MLPFKISLVSVSAILALLAALNFTSRDSFNGTASGKAYFDASHHTDGMKIIQVKSNHIIK